MLNVPGIYDKFKLYIRSTGASYPDASAVPLLESTERRYPWTEMLLRARDQRRLSGPANGFKTKIKWKVAKGYGPRLPGTPVTWQRRGSLEFLSSNYCQEFGTLQFIEDEVKKQIGSVWSAKSMAQQFDDVLENMFQDMHVDITETIEETVQRVPTELMEDGETNVPRSVFMGMNEWKAGHSTGGADGAYPGITEIENYDVSTPGAKMAATVVPYSKVGTEDGLTAGHFFEALTRGLREVDFRAVPLAEKYTQGTEGFAECFTSLEGIIFSRRQLAAQHNIIAEETFGKVYSLESRMKGLTMIDCPTLEDAPLCPDYDINGDPAPSDGTYVPGALEQVYKTELESAYGKGPRFYIPYQPHIRPIWDEENFMRKSPIYALEETTPDAMVCWVRNDRNLHFQSFRRNLVIRPDSSENDLGYGTA